MYDVCSMSIYWDFLKLTVSSVRAAYNVFLELRQMMYEKSKTYYHEEHHYECLWVESYSSIATPFNHQSHEFSHIKSEYSD